MTNHSLSRSLLFLSVSIAMLSGCEKDVTNIKLPESKPKLVVGCFISPQDTLITVTLTRSNPIWGTDHNNSNNLSVADASVTISNGTNSVTVPYNSMDEQYELQASLFPIVSGQTYYLNISTPKGESVSASCTVPISNLTSLTIDFIDTAAASANKKIKVKWQDIPNQTNYYRVFAQIGIIDNAIGDTLYNDMYSDNSLQNDNNKDGQEMSSIMEGGYYSYINGVQQSVTVIAYTIYLLTIDAEYYKYQYSLEHYTYGDPFSEPSSLYTNIKGGLGVFAAYQKIMVNG